MGPREHDPGPSPFPAGWDFLLSAEGVAALAQVSTVRGAGVPALTIGSRLRASGVAPDDAAVVLAQAELRQKGAAKFGEIAQHMLFTQAGLEQATRAAVSALHAERFAAAGCRVVADLGCGIGAESMALTAAGITVRAVELDPLTARLAAHNIGLVADGADVNPGAGLNRSPFSVTVGDALHTSLDGVDGVFLDPARRTAGHRNTQRLTSATDYSPPLSFAYDLASRMPAGIKLGPGFDRELIPATAEAQWVSVDGEVVEMGLWFGALARPGIRRSALVQRGGQRHELTAAADAPDVEVGKIGGYVYEPDGAVIRARLIGMLAESLRAGMLSEGIAYLTADSHTPTPFASAFRIIEELPAQEKQLKRALAARNIGTLEIKKRGVDVDPAALRTRLRLRGTEHATVIMTRARGRHVALLAERV